jgi:hypothetical protein
VYRQFVRALFPIGNLMSGFRIELASGSALAYIAACVFAALCFSVRRGRAARAVMSRITPP